MLDLGTGSGCIALAVAQENPRVEVHASDVSAAALEVAERNAAGNGLEGRVRFHQGDLFASLPDRMHGAIQMLLSIPRTSPRGNTVSFLSK